MAAYDQILDFINSLHIVDTHEHVPDESARNRKSDVLEEWLIHYFSCDLVSAGLSDEALAAARDSSRDLLERWKIVEPYWDAARSTGYGRSLDIAARDLYGVESVHRKTIVPLNEAFTAAREKGNHYRYVLKQKGHIALSLVDQNLSCDREFFASVVRLDEFVIPTHVRDLQAAGKPFHMTVHRLEDWEETMRLRLEQAISQGAVALKCGLAYMRSLYFAKSPRHRAEEQFNELFSEKHSPSWRQCIKVGEDCQNYMMHAILRQADQRGLTMQVHTGLQEGNGNVIANANPTLLTNLFLEYPNIKFDIFHMGYPFVMELGNLAKNFRNVFIDMCWGHIISPEAARRALVEWLDAVPANKISAFGGDYCFVDGIYGHQYLARRNVAASLAQKVADGTFDLDRARQIARWVFVDNPTRLFNLSDRLKATATGEQRAA